MINFLIVLLFFFLMEFVAWFSHKYMMHGFMWVWHESHHKPRKGRFELNDLFGFMFALPSAWLIILGAADYDWRFFAGLGIALYGVAYFLVHDVIIHQRLKWFTRSNHIYVRAIRWAHKMHHKHLSKDRGESFGFLYVAKKYWDKVKRDKALMAGNAKVQYAAEKE